MNIFFVVCILLFMSLEQTIGMQRAREESGDNQPIFSLSNEFQSIEEPILEYLSRPGPGPGPRPGPGPGQVMVSNTVLRLVCKMAYQFCDRNKKWVFTNKNFISFKEQMGKPWVESLLSILPCLSFYNSIDVSALKSDLELEEWEKEYIFVSREDLKCITKHACKLKSLHLHNIPYLYGISYSQSSDLDVLGCVDSLQSFAFDYDVKIFDNSIDLNELSCLSQFINLKMLSINSGLLYEAEEDDVLDFFSYFTNLEKLRLYKVESDNENESFATNLFNSLTCLKNLNSLDVHFFDFPDILPLKLLSSLENLRTLSIEFNDVNFEGGYDYSGTLPQLFGALTHLENVRIYDRGIREDDIDISEVISNNMLVKKKYPQLRNLIGNAVLNFD